MTSLFPDLQPRDWTDDPLHQTLAERSATQSKVDEATSLALHNWVVFHWSTRFKLESADYHAKVLRHIHRVPLNEEEVTVHDRLRHWQFDEFFFQLAGAFETLLQEINALYKMGLDSENVDWETFPKKGSEPLFRSLKPARFLIRHWADPWLVEVRKLRNASTHRHYPTFVTGRPFFGAEVGFTCTINWHGFGDGDLAKTHKNDERQLHQVCEDYLTNAHKMITACWRFMSEDWPIRV